MLRPIPLVLSIACLAAQAPGEQPGAAIPARGEPSPASPETLAWIRRNAIPLQGVEAGRGFADLRPLKALVADASVVALGEATHGTREFFQLKHRLLEFLALDMGFTVFAIEASQPEAFAVNDYVLNGRGNPAKALADLGFWTWNAEEVLDLVRWMRSYNEDPAHLRKLSFYGFDMQFDALAYAQAKAWLDGADPLEAAQLLRIKARMIRLPSRLTGRMTREGRAGWAAAGKDIEALIGRLRAHPPAGGLAGRQLQNLRILSQYAAMVADADGGSRVRDEAMAANLLWVRSQEPGAKVVLWAHNGHITFRPGSVDNANSMGWHLRRALGSSYRPIGFAFREGEFRLMLDTGNVKPHPAGTLDAALAAAELPCLALDLQRLPKSGPVRRWFGSPQGTWRIGAIFRPQAVDAFIEKEAITSGYDALIFVNRSTPARPAPILASDVKQPLNLGFEKGLEGWSNADHPGYETGATEQEAKEGTRALQVSFVGTPNPDAWWKTDQTLDAAAFRGGKVRFTGWIRTGGSPGFQARLWLRVDGKNGPRFMDYMQERPVTATGWTEVAIEGPVAEDAVNLSFGCTVMGEGTAWFDGLRLGVAP